MKKRFKCRIGIHEYVPLTVPSRESFMAVSLAIEKGQIEIPHYVYVTDYVCAKCFKKVHNNTKEWLKLDKKMRLKEQCL